jgi:hypothetical protein
MAIVSLQKQELNKVQYEKVINTSFSQLVPAPVASTFVNQTLPSVSEFFQYYQALFYQIPKLGSVNTHQYLVQTSGDYIGNSEATNETINALVEEITQLRQENLDLQLQINQTQNLSGSLII